jgi:hypothetical protein
MIVLSSPRPRSKQDIEKHGEQFEDALDRHVDDVLKSPSKWRRMLMGVWSFLKTRTSFGIELPRMLGLMSSNSHGSTSCMLCAQGLFLKVVFLI